MSNRKVAKRRRPDGRIHHGPKADYAPALIKRTIARALERGEDPALGSALGVMMFRGQITSAQFGAAQQYAWTIGAYDRLAGNRNRSVKSPAYHAGRIETGGDGPDAKMCGSCDCGGTGDCSVRDKLKRSYSEMDIVMGAKPAIVAYNAIIHDQRPNTHDELLGLVGALERLAGYLNGERRAA